MPRVGPPRGRLSRSAPLKLLNLLCLAGALALLGGCDPDKLPKLDLSGLPTGADGKPILIEIAGSKIRLDPEQRDALTALGACTDMVAYCVEGGEADLAGCVAQARECKTSTPWTESPCCPKGCQDAFAKAVKGGAQPLAAFDRTFFTQPDCFPGVRDALEGR